MVYINTWPIFRESVPCRVPSGLGSSSLGRAPRRGSRSGAVGSLGGLAAVEAQDSSKGGAVETGCSGLNDVIYQLVYIILPQSTAPPSDCTPL